MRSMSFIYRRRPYLRLGTSQGRPLSYDEVNGVVQVCAATMLQVSRSGHARQLLRPVRPRERPRSRPASNPAGGLLSSSGLANSI